MGPEPSITEPRIDDSRRYPVAHVKRDTLVAAAESAMLAQQGKADTPTTRRFETTPSRSGGGWSAQMRPAFEHGASLLRFARDE